MSKRRAKKAVLLRFDPDLLDRVDKKRGLIPREVYLRNLIGKALDANLEVS